MQQISLEAGKRVYNNHWGTSLGEENKYKSSSLKLRAAQDLIHQMNELLRREKCYLDPNLSLANLSRQLNTNTKYLSQAINLCLKMNFHQCLNSYRIEEIKSILKRGTHNHYTYYGLSQQCGFKNKSTFYKVFKEVMGITPGEYIEQQLRKEA